MPGGALLCFVQLRSKSHRTQLGEAHIHRWEGERGGGRVHCSALLVTSQQQMTGGAQRSQQDRVGRVEYAA